MPLLEGYEEFQNVSPALQWAIFIVGCLILVAAVIATGVSIWLWTKYVKFNRMKNSCGLSGGEVARKVLDENGLKNINVSTWGSLIFGNSYSHYFHKVRIRRLTKNQKSLTSMAIGAEKSALAIMDKEGDKDMRQRVALTPFIYFGPFAFIPLLVLGIVLDIIFFNFNGAVTIGSAVVGIVLYVISFVLSIKVLKTEVKAQKRACEILKANGMATDAEIANMQELFHLYNIQYVIDIIIALLQMIMKALEIAAKFQNGNGKNSIND